MPCMWGGTRVSQEAEGVKGKGGQESLSEETGELISMFKIGRFEFQKALEHRDSPIAVWDLGDEGRLIEAQNVKAE